MKRIDRMKLLRFAVYTVVIVLLFVIESTPSVIPEVLGAKPSLVMGAAVCIALMGEGEVASMAFGVFCGLLMDYIHGGVYGFNAVMLAVICFFISMLVRNLFQKGLVSALVMTAAVIIIVFLMHWIFYYLVRGYDGRAFVLIHHYLPMAGYTLVAAAPVYAAFRGLSALLRSERVSS